MTTRLGRGNTEEPKAKKRKDEKKTAMSFLLG